MTGLHSGGGRWAGGRKGGGCGYSPRSLANCQCGFWLGGRPRASGQFSLSTASPAAYERSELDLTPAGRGSPLTPFPFSLPLRPGPFYSSYSESACQSVSAARGEGLMDQTRQAEDRKRRNELALLLPLRSMIFRDTISGRFFSTTRECVAASAAKKPSI